MSLHFGLYTLLSLQYRIFSSIHPMAERGHQHHGCCAHQQEVQSTMPSPFSMISITHRAAVSLPPIPQDQLLQPHLKQTLSMQAHHSTLLLTITGQETSLALRAMSPDQVCSLVTKRCSLNSHTVYSKSLQQHMALIPPPSTAVLVGVALLPLVQPPLPPRQRSRAPNQLSAPTQPQSKSWSAITINRSSSTSFVRPNTTCTASTTASNLVFPVSHAIPPFISLRRSTILPSALINAP